MNDIFIEDDMTDVLYGDIPALAPVTDLEKAESAIHRVLMASGRIAEAEARVKEAKMKMDRWLQGVIEDENRIIMPETSALLPWAKNEILDKKTKSVKTMAGTVKFRATKGKTIDSDKEKTLEWYKENYPNMVIQKVTFAVLANEAKALYRESGEKAPTIDFEEPTDKMYIEEGK